MGFNAQVYQQQLCSGTARPRVRINIFGASLSTQKREATMSPLSRCKQGIMPCHLSRQDSLVKTVINQLDGALRFRTAASGGPSLMIRAMRRFTAVSTVRCMSASLGACRRSRAAHFSARLAQAASLLIGRQLVMHIEQI